ncbi:hypothetical protein K1J08_12160, partial [Streptococcus sanguinis]
VVLCIGMVLIPFTLLYGLMREKGVRLERIDKFLEYISKIAAVFEVGLLILLAILLLVGLILWYGFLIFQFIQFVKWVLNF